MKTIKRFSVQADLANINAALEEDGCVVIDNILEAHQVGQITQELVPHFDAVPHCQGNFYGHVTKRLSSLLVRSALARQLAIHPMVLGVMDEFLHRGCRHYQLNLTQAIQIGPGEPRQILHADDLFYPFDHPKYEAMINCMWAIDDFTVDNGATHVVPGSHKWPRDRKALPEESVQAEMSKGSLLIYFASLRHGGGANKTGKTRTGLVISYCLGWLRQAENQYLAVPLDMARTFPQRLQKLMGYFVHEPNVGCVDGQDPLLLLQGKDIASVGFKEFLPQEVESVLQEHRAKELSLLKSQSIVA